MAFKCLDCGNKSSKRFPAGRCPACDSFNVKSTHKQQGEQVVSPKKSLFQRILALSLWALVLYGVWENYIKA